MSSTFRADCSQCPGLCCIASPFFKSADFARDKPAGTPCPHLSEQNRCGIHDHLHARGYPGCASFDCYGAGQRLAAQRDDNADWRAHPKARPQIFEAFYTLHGVCELGWHLDAALARDELPPALRARLETALNDVQEAISHPGDPTELRTRVSELLIDASLEIRAHHGVIGPSHARQMLLGRSMRGGAFARSSFFAACLVGTDLRGADLRHADLRGTDMRGADLRAADLRDVLFLTPGQLERTKGDRKTRLSTDVERPAHWEG